MDPLYPADLDENRAVDDLYTASWICSENGLVHFQKYFVVHVHKRLAVNNSFSTYVCYTPDGLFWLNLYRRTDLILIAFFS